MVKVANIVFIVSFVLCAFVISNNTTMDYTAPRFLILGIATLALFVLMIRNLEYNLLYALFLIFWLLVTFSILMAVNKGEAISRSANTIVLIVYLAIASILLRNNRIFPKVVILVTMGLAIYSFYDYKGMMANKNQCAVVLFLLGILCLHYYRDWKIPSAIALLLSAVSIALLRARAVWLAIFISGIIYAVTNRKYLIPIACGYVVIGCIGFCVNMSSIFNTESLSQRKEIWTQALRLVRDNPAGFGAGNWKIVYPISARDAPITRQLNYKGYFVARVHNNYLEVCSEIGIFGLLSYLSIFVYALYLSRGWIRTGIVGYMMIIFFSISANRLFPSLLLMILFALTVKKKNCKSLRLRYAPVMGMLLIAGILNIGVRYLGARQVVRIYKAQAVSDWDTVLKETEKVSRLSNIDVISATPIEHYRGIAYHFKGDNVNAMKSFERAEAAAPYHLYNLMNLADMYTVDGQYNAAKVIYRKVGWMYPDFEAAKEGVRNIDAARQKIFNVVQEIERLKQQRR